jgi:5S rRNA maturation endonuclease (ribonuclease M5)
MAKISPVAAKYIIHSTITIEGVVDRPDVIGAVFGQTEGLLGSELELRELQRSGRIGRIEVNLNTISGKTSGEIIIPSSLDKTETAIVAAALEIIQRIGPCNAKIVINKIEDVRVSKRQFVIERAKELLRDLTEKTLPDSQELADEVAQSVRMMEVSEYGRERLAAGPAIDESDEVVIVEGRADVLNLLKHGFKNAIAMNGTSCPQTIKELSHKKTMTIFVDGDRGGDLIIRELLSVAEIDFVCKAPDGKEVEEITKKEIHKALRGRVTAEQAKLDLGIDSDGALKDGGDSLSKQQKFRPGNGQSYTQYDSPSPAPTYGPVNRPVQGGQGGQGSSSAQSGNFSSKKQFSSEGKSNFSRSSSSERSSERPLSSRPGPSSAPSAGVPSGSASSTISGAVHSLTAEEKRIFKETMEDLFGTRGACIFDSKMTILGKVPLSELGSTLKSLNGGIYALALDGSVDIDLVRLAERLGITYVVGTNSKVKDTQKVNVLTDEKLA